MPVAARGRLPLLCEPADLYHGGALDEVIPMTIGSLCGHTALVTGGSRGIGAAIVRMLADAGAAVVINYLERATDADALAKAIGDNGGRASAIAADVSHAAPTAKRVERQKPRLGPFIISAQTARTPIP